MEFRVHRNRPTAIVAGLESTRRAALSLWLAPLVAAVLGGCCSTGMPASCVAPYDPVSYPDSLYFGHYPTCWKQWPAEWANCPAGFAESVQPQMPSPSAPTNTLPSPMQGDSTPPNPSELKLPPEDKAAKAPADATPAAPMPAEPTPVQPAPKEPAPQATPPIEPMPGAAPPSLLPPETPPAQPPKSEPKTPPPGQSRRRTQRTAITSFDPPGLPPPPPSAVTRELRDRVTAAPRREAATPVLFAPPDAVQRLDGAARPKVTSASRPTSKVVSAELPSGRSGAAEAKRDIVVPPPPPPATKAVNSRRSTRPRPAKPFTPVG